MAKVPEAEAFCQRGDTDFNPIEFDEIKKQASLNNFS